MDTQNILQALKGCNTFAVLSDEELTAIADVITLKTIPLYEVLFQEGEHADFFDIILEGKIQLYNDWDDEELVLVDLAEGELVGEADYFETQKRQSSARAEQMTTTLRIDYKDLPRLFDEIPGLYTTFIAQQFKETNSRFRQNLKRRRVVERSLKHLNQFLDLSDMSSIGEGSEGLIKRIVHMASKVMKAERASLFLVDEETGDLWSKVAQGEGHRTIWNPKGKGIAGWVLENDEIVNIPDAYADPRFNQDVDKATGYRTRSILCGPIKNLSGKIIGVIQVINKLSGETTEDDIQLFRAFAHQAAVAVDNFFLFQRLVDNNDRMAVMLDVLDTVTQAEDMQTLISKIVDKTAAIMQCDRATFFVADAKKRELWSFDALDSGAEKIRFPISKGVAGYCALNDATLNIKDAYKDPRFNPEIDKVTGYQTKTILCAPVHDRNGKVVGVTEAINKKGGPFEKEDIDMLRAVCSQISEALKKANLLEQLKSANEQLAKSNAALEATVTERTTSLRVANEQLATQNDQLQVLNTKKNEFLGMAAHDLRNPLSSISGIAKVLLDSMKEGSELTISDEERRELLAGIEQSSGNMFHMIDELVDTEALATGNVTLRPEQCDIAKLVQEVVNLNQPQARQKGILLNYEKSEPVPAELDPRRIKEVFDNLISNAVKYSSPGSQVWIALQRDLSSGKAHFSVKDQGPGFQEEERSKIFGKFQKLSARPTGNESSTGLGLYITKKMVDLHRGTIWVESQYNEGSTFHVKLPTEH